MLCKCCGMQDSNPEQYSRCEEREIMEANGFCFGCAFWEGLVCRPPSGRAIIDGTHYVIGNRAPSRYNGFGGQRFHIAFNNGTEVVTHDLWCQGAIPEAFRPRLQDNARFVRD